MSLAGFTLTLGQFVEQLSTGKVGTYCGLDPDFGLPVIRFDDDRPGISRLVHLEDLTLEEPA